MAEIPWFDTHVHLDRYDLAERAAILERAGAANVAVIAVGVDIESSRDVCAIEGAAGQVVGVHPKYATSKFERELRELAAAPDVVAIGECGFDDAGVDWETQGQAFAVQCRLARECGLSLVLHIDGAEAWRHLESVGAALDGLRVVRHYFTGDRGQARWHRERGHYLSFGKPLLREPRIQGVSQTYPAELILIETDAYPVRGRTTEPADVVGVGGALAAIRKWTGDRARGWSVDETRERLAANTLAAFPGLRL